MVDFKEIGKVKHSTDIHDVVVAVSPSFGNQQKQTIIGVPHKTVLKEVSAGIEEEGMKVRFIKFYNSIDLAFIANKGAKLSGSGISIGIQSKGTMMIHQKDLEPLDNLELFPQAPLYNETTFRKVGQNAAKYAKGEIPIPVETLNDQMALSKYQIKAALLQLKESRLIAPKKEPEELEFLLG